MALICICGPCVIESRQLCIDIAGFLKEATECLGMSYFFKASFDKANRTSSNSYRGVGIDLGLKILEDVRKYVGVSILTDVHTEDQIKPVASVVDMIQTPAFLCRQTDFIRACAQSGKPVNFKKGQFLSPYDMSNVIRKAQEAASEIGLPTDQFFCCERGTSFGYGNLVVDMRGLAVMRHYAPVIFDATHSVQLPGGQGTSSGGQREFVPVLARAAAAVGVSGFFFETHPDPDKAKSDGPNMVPLSKMRGLLEEIKEIDYLVKHRDFLEETYHK